MGMRRTIGVSSARLEYARIDVGYARAIKLLETALVQVAKMPSMTSAIPHAIRQSMS